MKYTFDLAGLPFKPSTLVDLLKWRALHHPEQALFTFLADGETEALHLTYGELDRQARAIGAALQDRHKGGERALLLYPPGLEYIAGFFGCLYAGVIAVPAYPPDPSQLDRTLPKLRSIAADAQATVALTTTPILSLAAHLFKQAPDLAGLQWLATDTVTDKVAGTWQEPAITGESLAFLQYTSGSTRSPRGVMLSHDNLLANSAMIHRGFRLTSEDVGVIWLPPYHDMGLIGGILQPIYAGFCCVLMSPISFLQKPFRWLEAVSRYQATVSGGPNFAYDLCVRKITAEQRATLDLSTWRVAFNGAEAVRSETLDRFVAAFVPCGFRREAFYPCYGLAEATLIVSGGLKTAPPTIHTVKKAGLVRHQVIQAQSGEGSQALVSCGYSLLDERVVIANPETLAQAAPGEIGEILVSGPNVAHGYWNQAAETEQTFRAYLADSGDGPFLRTGDLGFLRNGQLFVTGRIKDVIIIRGRNHYPQDIELTVERSHPAFRPGCGAAFSVSVNGEERLAVVQEVYTNRPWLPQELLNTIGRAVAAAHELEVYTIALISPRTIPKTSSGKIQRRRCREEFLAGTLNVLASTTLDERALLNENKLASQETENGKHDTLLVKALLAMKPEERQTLLISHLRQQVAQTLNLAPSKLAPDQPLNTLALDSIATVELAHVIESSLNVSLPLATLIRGTSLSQLADQILAQLLTAAPAPTPVDSGSRQAAFTDYPLSHGQRALWFLQQVSPNSAAYNLVHAARTPTELDIPAYRRAFQRLVERHPTLRTTFPTVNGEPVQRVHQHMEVDFHVEDASGWSQADLNSRLAQEMFRPFHLEQGPLMRVIVFAHSPTEYVTLLAKHHTITDLWSLALFMYELGAFYTAELTGESPSLKPLRTRYTDYVQQQAEMLAGPEGEQLWAYWQKQLSGELPVLDFPTDHPRPPVQSDRGAAHSIRLDATLTRALRDLAGTQDATLFMTLLAAYHVLLHRYTGQEDILIGSPTAGRNRKVARLIGYFVNPLVLRANLSGKPTFATFLDQVRQTTLDAFAHGDYPFPLLVEQLQPARDPSRPPLIQVVFAWQKTTRLVSSQDMTSFALGEHGARLELGELILESTALDHRVAPFDLMLLMAEAGDELVATVEYNVDLFTAGTIARLLANFEALLRGIVADPDEQIARLPLLSESERRQLLVAWNETEASYPHNRCAHQLFEAVAARQPQAAAVTFEGDVLTYGQLNQRANQLAHFLQKLGVGAETLVGISMERSLEMIVGVLGVLKAGGAYVPLDPTYPPQRLAYMLADAQAPILLTQQSLISNPQSLISNRYVVYLDTDWSLIAQEPAVNPVSNVLPDNLAYTIYTSGSTGRPKGTLLHHRGLCSFITDYSRRFGLGPGSRLLQFSSFSFDASVAEIFMALLNGATLCLARRETLLNTAALLNLLREQRITAAIIPPSMLSTLPVEELPGLQSLMSAGEVCSSELVSRWAPGRRFFNGYGPTEATIGPTIYQVQNPDDEGTNIPIGRPIDNIQVHLLDQHLQPVPIGVPGEIHIGGVGLARGYLNQPELTAEKFIPNPFSREPGARLYKVGDLARYRADGNLEFLGRIDHQVKVRGFRIELGELEAALTQHPAVQEAVVLAREDTPGDRRLVAYVVPEKQRQLELWPSVAEFYVYDDLLYYAMTSDERRNASYQVALKRHVPDKVALDIGTGKDAILARFCVEAGAKRVYAVELLEESFRQAKTLVESLGLEEQIILIHGDSTAIDLPEQVDVCVSEIVGPIGGCEGAAVILNDARRFLKDGGPMIPTRSLTRIAAVSLPHEFIKAPAFSDGTRYYVEQIFDQVGYKFDLRLCLKGVTAADLISTGAIFEDLDFADTVPSQYSREITLTITKDARLDGFLVWLNLYTTQDEVIDILTHEHCWLPVYFPVFYPGVEVAEGDTITAVVSSQLSGNNLNPDYKVTGSLIRQNGTFVEFEYDSYHDRHVYRATPFYNALFAGDNINVRQDGQTSLSLQELREHLKQRLPEFMLPSAFMVMEALPLTPNGKVDRKSLPAPDGARPALDSTYVRPRTALEETMVAVWQEILNVNKVGVHDNFFELGGHSLQLARIHSRLQEILGHNLPMVEMFRYPTISALATYLSQEPNGQPQLEKSYDRAQKQKEALRRQRQRMKAIARKEGSE